MCHFRVSWNCTDNAKLRTQARMMSSPLAPILELQGYGFSFGSRVIVADASFSLSAHGLSVLMGPMGTGKSSLLFSLAGFNSESPRFRQWGNAYFCGKPLAGTNRPFLVRQHARLLADTLINHLLKSSELSALPQSERRNHIENWLSGFDMPALLDKVNQRLVEVDPVWQRIALMVLAAQAPAPLLLVDEPATGLSNTDSKLLMDFVQNLGQRQKLLVVAHNQTSVRAVANDVILLAGGRIQGHLPVQSFFAEQDNPVIRTFVQTGSVSLPAPDAKPEDLAEGISPPPPLPAAALAAIREFYPYVSELEPATPPNATPAAIPEPPPPPAIPPLPPPIPAAPVTSTKTAPAYLQTSRNGVRMVAEIGTYENAFDARAPRGFVWVVPGQLAGCPQPGVTNPVEYDLQLLARIGITILVTLTENDLEQAPLEEAGLRNLHLPVYDRGVPSMRQIYMLLHRMLRLVEQGEVLAIHCLAGLGRTGTVLAAWMIKEGGLSAAEAIRRLRLLQPGFIQSQEQEEFLFFFEKDLLNRTL
jgi:atypical dual specificity phosphatase